MRELYVWYRVAGADAVALRACVLERQRDLRDRVPGLVARLLVRRSSGEETWMETYARPTTADRAGLDAATEARIEETFAPLAARFAGGRHIEAFDDVDVDADADGDIGVDRRSG